MAAITTSTTQETRTLLRTPGAGHQTLLVSFRRNGEGVSSPVGTVASQGKLYFMTPATTWKVKRLAKNSHVTVAPCTRQGEQLGPAVEGTARRIFGEEMKRARSLLRVGIIGNMFNIIFDIRYPGDKTAVYEIILADEVIEHEAPKETQKRGQ